MLVATVAWYNDDRPIREVPLSVESEPELLEDLAASMLHDLLALDRSSSDWLDRVAPDQAAPEIGKVFMGQVPTRIHEKAYGLVVERFPTLAAAVERAQE